MMNISARAVIFVLTLNNLVAATNAFSGLTNINRSILKQTSTSQRHDTSKEFAPQCQMIGVRPQSSLCASNDYKDTAVELPSFDSKEEYTEYLMNASALPKGFATGSAQGTFVPQEAPSMGSLPIKGTIIHLVDGPTDSWAATFTQNKVLIYYNVPFLSCIKSAELVFLICPSPPSPSPIISFPDHQLKLDARDSHPENQSRLS